MLILVVPLFGESPALIEDIAKRLSPDRLIICHTWSKKGSAHQNAQVLSYHLQSNLEMDGEVEVRPLNCSEHPFSLGDSFTSMLLRDSAVIETALDVEYHVLITQDTPLGYFFGLTALSGSSIKVSCHLGSTSMDISRIHPNDFQPEMKNIHSIHPLPLFEDILEAKNWLYSHKGSKSVFKLVQDWYDADHNRYRDHMSFKTSTLVEHAASNGEDILQSRISNQISNLIACRKNIRLVDRSEESSQHYRLTSIGRTVGWITRLEE